MGQLIKKGDAPETTPFNLVDMEAEAKAIVDAAKAHARALLDSVMREAERLREKATREGRQHGYEEGRKKGYAEGLDQGKAEGSRTVVDGAKTVVDALSAVLSHMEARRQALLEESRREVVRLALRAAERVVRREIGVDPGVMERGLTRAVELTARKTDLDVRVNPADLAVVQAFLPTLARQFSDLSVARISGDETVERGGCVVKTPEGSVDADIATQLAELDALLLGNLSSAGPEGPKK